MLVLKLELHSAITGAITEIGRMYIANIDGTAERGDYIGAVARKGCTTTPQPVDPKGPKPTRSASVSNFPRLRHNVWRLVLRMLQSAFPEEKSFDPDDNVVISHDKVIDAMIFKYHNEDDIVTLLAELKGLRGDAP